GKPCSLALCKRSSVAGTMDSPMRDSTSISSARLRTFFRGGVALALIFGLGCGPPDDDPETEADRFGVGAACSVDEDCEYETDDDDTGGPVLECLSQFSGGYCGVIDCVSNDDCPEASGCVAHDDGRNYCFR